MEEREQIHTPNYYSILTAQVRYDKDLQDKAKLLYSEITALANSKGYCYATNDYFAKLYNTTTRTIANHIRVLKEKGYIFVEYTYKPNSKEIAQRRMYVRDMPHAIGDENIFTTPHEKNITQGSEKNFLDNNTRDLILQEYMIHRYYSSLFIKEKQEQPSEKALEIMEILKAKECCITREIAPLLSHKQLNMFNLMQDTILQLYKSQTYKPYLQKVNFNLMKDTYLKFTDTKEKQTIDNDLNYYKTMIIKEITK